jgi:hypothetical protein
MMEEYRVISVNPITVFDHLKLDLADHFIFDVEDACFDFLGL